MRIEFMPGTDNVVRFPVERRARPSLDLLREIAPDCREVSLVAEAFGFGDPLFTTRNDVDREMAEYIINNVRPEPGPERRAELDGLLASLVARAVDACRLAHDAAVASVAAQNKAAEARIEGGYWLYPLEEAATWKSNEAARLLVEAYLASETAEGAARAIGLARRGEEWAPLDLRAEAQALFFGEERGAAGTR